MTDIHPPWFSAADPTPERCVLTQVLQRRAQQQPNSRLFSFEDGSAWSCEETWQRMQAAAELLAGHGVTRGNHVLVWLPSGPDMIQAWLGANYLGAVFVPLNIDYRGNMLAHAINTSAAALMVSHPGLVERLEDRPDIALQRVLVPGAASAQLACGAEVVQIAFPGQPQTPPPPADVAPWDLQMVIFTSGTTGASKGVMCSYAHTYSTALATYGYLAADDCMLVELPLFHVGGVASVIAALVCDARLAVYPGFSTGQFWARIEREGATAISGLIGSMASFLHQSPAREGEAENSLRMVTLMLSEQAIAVSRRFRFSYISGFNMTELSGPLITEVNCPVAGSLGKPRAGCECRVVDDHDYPCADDVVGELVVRSEQPWTFFSGYLGQPQATADAWRNGWFHTGDLVRRDASGNYFFVDRKKDSIRRRGENISSVEVEAETAAFPGVAEACAVAVASEHGEDELLVAVVAAEGESIAPRALVEFLIPRVPHFMVPRYVRVLEQLPRTPTNKVRKVVLRDQGITDDTWDREAENIILGRTRLS